MNKNKIKNSLLEEMKNAMIYAIKKSKTTTELMGNIELMKFVILKTKSEWKNE